MKRCCARSARFGRAIASLGFVTGIFCCSVATPLFANPPGTIVRVEEDWTLSLNEPEVNNNSPQVTCTMAPAEGFDDGYMSFELNHASYPEYETGGLHLQAWDGVYVHGCVCTQDGEALRTAHEHIDWTQTMSVANGQLTYAITNGSSTTWGSFGTGELSLSIATSFTNLNNYDYNTSIRGSGVGYGSNRVGNFTLKRVRYVLDDGDVVEVNVNHNVLGNGN